MNRIKQMPKSLSEKIAAGEVITRPLSAVKELIENAIDAQADNITVELKNGGKSYIRVSDNGSGIAKDDVQTAFLPHATSKIEHDDDLDRIRSLGFRGEALTSIAAVSKVELITKTSDEKTGTSIKVEGGEVQEIKDIGTSEGTNVVVKDLFFNTPARLKFMKDDRVEASAVIDLISKIALAYPAIKIRLINNGNVLFSTNGKGDTAKNILTVYGKELAKDLLTVDSQTDDMKIGGFISAPTNSRASRKNQIFFVNGRIIENKIIEKAVTEAYRELLFERRYPIIYLFLEIDPDALDVNVHPAKTEIRFKDENSVKSILSDTLRKILLSKNAAPEMQPDGNNSMKREAGRSDIMSFDRFTIEKAPGSSSGKSDIGLTDNEKTENKRNQVDIKSLLSKKNIEINENAENYTPKPIESAIDIGKLRILGVAFASYIIAQDDETVYFIDQHAAHERIYYEKLLKQYKNEAKPAQTLLSPYIIKPPYSAGKDVYDWDDMLSDLGFEIEEFGNDSYLVKSVPAFMSFIQAEDYLNYIIDNVDSHEALLNETKIEELIMRSCKSAIKANDRLDEDEIAELLKELDLCDNPYSCPHGRPVFVKLRKTDIERLFKRK